MTDMTALVGWENFYVIVGSSAGALIGLQFVVMALIANLPRTPGQAQAGHAFATPNIVHFGTVLFLAAALCAPLARYWRGRTLLGPRRPRWGFVRPYCGSTPASATRIPANTKVEFDPALLDESGAFFCVPRGTSSKANRAA